MCDFIIHAQIVTERILNNRTDNVKQKAESVGAWAGSQRLHDSSCGCRPKTGKWAGGWRGARTLPRCS